jgi:hypothetical protein
MIRLIYTLLWSLVIVALALVECDEALAQDGSSTEGGTGSKNANVTPTPGAGIYAQMPAAPLNAGDRIRTAKERLEVRGDPALEGVDLPPDSPPVDVGPLLPDFSSLQAPLAAGDFRTIRNSNLDPSSGGNNTSTIDEPSLGVNGRVAFYTGNWFAAFSGDGGQTWNYVDPYDNFPANGTNDVPTGSGGFCCDQVVYYEPTRGLMVWYLQYVKSGENPNQDSNVGRLAIANSQEDVLNNNWFWWDLEPSDVGQANPGTWFDYPDISSTDDHLFLTTNVFNVVAPSPTDPQGRDTYLTSAIMRFPLDELADGGNTTWRYWTRNRGTLRPTQGATSTMYFGTHEDNNTLRVYYVADGSNSLNVRDIDHGGFNRLASTSTFTDVMTATCPDNNNYAGRTDSRILGAWYSSTSNELGFMWNADEADGSGDVSSTYTFPYVRILRIRRSDWNLQQQRSIWNGGHAWIYPSVNVNDRGHIAGSVTAGCGTFYPRTLAWIVDDYNSPAFPSMDDFENYAFASSDDAPTSDDWGDYLTTRKHIPYHNTWVASGFRMAGGGGNADVVPEFIWFGRERDLPPGTNIIWVDKTNTTGYETGTQVYPYNTADEGEVALQPGDELRILNGTYLENVLFDTDARVRNWNGTVIITGPTGNTPERLEASEEEPQ